MKKLLAIIPAMVFCATPYMASADAVTSARLDSLYNDSTVVTGVDTTAFATSAELQSVVAYVTGEDAMDWVTNYNSNTALPQRELRVKQDGNWITVWKEMTRWRDFLGADDTGDLTWIYSNATNLQLHLNALAADLSQRAYRNWGQYDSETGLLSPEDTVQISSASVIMGKHAGFQNVVSTEGNSAWFLVSEDPTLLTTGSDGTFTINPAGHTGTPLFQVIHGSERTAYWVTDNMVCSNESGVVYYYVHSPLVSASHPTAKFVSCLTNQNWITEGETGCPCPSVTWYGESGDWTMKAQAASGTNSWFATATYVYGHSDDQVLINGEPIVTEDDVEEIVGDLAIPKTATVSTVSDILSQANTACEGIVADAKDYDEVDSPLTVVSDDYSVSLTNRTVGSVFVGDGTNLTVNLVFANTPKSGDALLVVDAEEGATIGDIADGSGADVVCHAVTWSGDDFTTLEAGLNLLTFTRIKYEPVETDVRTVATNTYLVVRKLAE